MALKTQESLADDISQGHGKHQQPSHNKQARHPMTMTAQGRTESLIPAIQQGQPTTAEPTHPSNVEPLSSEATGGIRERRAYNNKKDENISRTLGYKTTGPSFLLQHPPPQAHFPLSPNPVGRPSLSHIINMYQTTPTQHTKENSRKKNNRKSWPPSSSQWGGDMMYKPGCLLCPLNIIGTRRSRKKTGLSRWGVCARVFVARPA